MRSILLPHYFFSLESDEVQKTTARRTLSLENIHSFPSPQILNNNKKSRFSLEAGFFLAIQNLSDEEMYTIRKKAISFASKKPKIFQDDVSSDSKTLDTKSEIRTPLVFTPYGRLWFQKLLLKNSQLINELSYSHLYFSKNL